MNIPFTKVTFLFYEYDRASDVNYKVTRGGGWEGVGLTPGFTVIT